MARTYRPTYDYNDHTLTPPTPGADLILQVGLVQSLPGIGPKTGGQYIGIPRVIGPLHTRLWRPHDQVEMTLPNTELQLWNTPFVVAGHRQGVFDLAARPGWQWLRWTIADHVAHDHQRVAKADHEITPVYPNTHAEPLVIVPCGATKAAFPRVAGELYTGGYRRLALRAAHALTTCTNIRIVSGLHGLLPLDQVIAPYDLRLGQPGSITVDQLEAQANQQGLLGHPDVVILAGRDYTRLVHQIWPQARTPLASTRGIGEQQHRLARIAARS
ncbi:hypothetical protein O4328_29010 [Rhodococcus opacus]|uniref:DUF6884 domain-containing protein n=1 Tax=Rhodococcus opacus TaxID=37919 RepID=A0AAX3YT64_RHOOP|nr:DUF6884 domain-containing protein [Rhodococcus opacus]MCZ4587682.1 hypothetical protein [Rhodococcus opacus]WLF51322.1 hypothetical protein Q5707_38830 [Rhodococcus opacus]